MSKRKKNTRAVKETTTIRIPVAYRDTINALRQVPAGEAWDAVIAHFLDLPKNIQEELLGKKTKAFRSLLDDVVRQVFAEIGPDVVRDVLRQQAEEEKHDPEE